MRKYCFILIPVYILLSCQAVDQIEITRDGESDYYIIAGENPDSLEQRAAKELQFYLETISGVRIPLINTTTNREKNGIWVGKTSLLDNITLADRQILIKEMNDQLVIAGSDPESTLYAVYSFLEEFLDCRFYSPEVEEIPQNKNIKLNKGIFYTYIPGITTRTVHSRLFYDHPEFADKRKVTHEAFPDYVPEARVHTFHNFLPKEIFYESFPEYYALRNGKRLPTQLCLTNPDVFHIVRDSVQAMIKRYPEARVISVSQDDNQQYCQCSSCEAIHEREGSPAGSMISFVNQIAKEFPDKIISTLAYQYTRKAPRYIKPAKNVLITLCSIECDRSAPIYEKCTDFSLDLVEWGQITENIRIWDYTTQFTNFLAPFPNLYTLQPNIQLFLDNNARWIFEQHSHHPSELFELRSYLTAKLLWEPELDVSEVMNDFLNGYYHDAGPYIQKYISGIHKELKKDPEFILFLYGDPSQAFDSFLNPEVLGEYDYWFDQAEKSVEDNPEVLQRVKHARLGVDYAILEASRKNLYENFSMVSIDTDGNKTVNKDLLTRLDEFEKNCRSAHIEYMNETRFTLEEYLEQYKQTSERAKKPNLAINKPVKLQRPADKYANEDPQVLTDGAYGGSSFYANWLGFEGSDMEAVVDLNEITNIHEISSAFLQVTNHLVFFPEKVAFYYSIDGENYFKLGDITNKNSLTSGSKTNDIQYFILPFDSLEARYIKIIADNMGRAPVWHHGAGMSSWIFADEVEVR